MYYFTESSQNIELPSLIEYMFPFLGTFISGWFRRNSPREGSIVYPLTPLPVESTKWVEEPYKQYPAATKDLPSYSKSSTED